MTVKHFLAFFGILLLLKGLMYLFAMDFTYSLYDLEDGRTPLSDAFLGAIGILCIGAGLMGWFGRKARKSIGRRAILVFFTSVFIILFVQSMVSLFSTGIPVTMDKVDMLIQAIGAFGGTYFLTKEKDLLE